MSKMKKLVSLVLTLPLLSCSSTFAMDSIDHIEKSEVAPLENKEILPKLPENYYFNEKKLYNNICQSLFKGTKGRKELTVEQKVKIMDEAIKLIENYTPSDKLSDVISVTGKEQFEKTINSCILNFERTGKRNSVATAFILHYLAEYMNLPSVIKVVICGDKSIDPNVKSTLCTVFQDKPLLSDGSCFWLKSTVSGTITCDHSHYNPLGDKGVRGMLRGLEALKMSTF